MEKWRDHLVCETCLGSRGGRGTNGRMVHTRKYKYIVYSWGKYREQLFDMETDPGEMVNLAVESRYQDILNQHRNLLAEWIKKTDDQYERHYSHPKALPLLPGQEF